MIAGGVESMSRAPFVMPKAESAFCAHQRGLRHDHRLALRQPADEGALRRRLDARDGRERRHRLQDRARGAGPHGAGLAAAGAWRRRRRGFFDAEIVPVTIAAEEGRARSSSPRTSIRARPASRRWPSSRASCGPTARVTAGNASGVNDGACALLLAERGRGREARPDAARARRRHGDRRRARRASWASARRRRRARCWR